MVYHDFVANLTSKYTAGAMYILVYQYTVYYTLCVQKRDVEQDNMHCSSWSPHTTDMCCKLLKQNRKTARPTPT